MIKGRIHSIETFGTVDGPGIRCVIFMQGCFVGCIFCHNRDTWNPDGGKEYDVNEILDIILKYKSYYQLSRGGITLSGGEPLLQAEFSAELFKGCKKYNINTALNTSGFTDIDDKIDKLLMYTDLILLDLKHIDPIKHKKITGKDNQKILNFARYIDKKNIPLWIRYIIIPGYTDEKEDVEKLCDFLSKLESLNRIELLPYHRLGVYKWKQLGLNYPLEEINPPTKEHITEIARIFDSHNLRVIY